MPFFSNMCLTFLIRVLLINGAFWTSVLGAKRSAASTQTCNTTECTTAAELIEKYMDTSINPCDNFYKFVCNGITQYDVMDGDYYISTLAETTERIQTQLKATIKLGKEDNDPEAFQKLHSHYKACLDIGKVNSKSTTILSDILKKLGGWPVLVGDSWDDSTFDWKTLPYKFRRLGYADSMNSLISFGIEVDEKNTLRYVITLDDAATGLNNEYLIKGNSNRQVTAYYKYMVRTAKRLGANRWFAGFDLAQSLLFEMKLAQISLTTEKRRNKTQLYNLKNIDELEYEYPEFGWTEYINNLLWPHHNITFRDLIVVRNPPYLKALSDLISRTPKRVIANYAIWRMVQESIPFMNDQLQELRADFNALTTGTSVLLSRSEQCIEYVAAHIPIAVGALYVRKVFDKNLKQKVTELVNELIESFQSTMEKKAGWMEKETRVKALMKLHSMYKHVAYPEELLDNQKLDEYFADLKATPDSYLDSYLSVNLFDMDDLYTQLRASNDKTEWTAHGSSTITDASYQPTENSIDIPAGLIQKELFAIGRPNYMNYGILGWIIGRNLPLAFDDTGSQYDEEGNLADWWDPKTRQKYQHLTECIVKKYSNYAIMGNKINGVNTQGENLADTIGIQQAYYAYKEYEKKEGVEPRLPGLSSYTPGQLFWMSAASVWCEKLTPEALKDMVATEKRCPSEIRVIGSFSNMYEFSQDFNCPLGTHMNPEPKCVIW